MDAGKDHIRQWLRSLLTFPPGATVVDLGCGNGDDLMAMARADRSTQFIGIDVSSEAMNTDKAANCLSNLRFIAGDLAKPLPFENGTVDAIFSVNLLECLQDRVALILECSRVMQEGGAIVMAHFDWDTQTFDCDDRDLVRKIIHAFNDWKQDWMGSVDPWAGRRLSKTFAVEAVFEGEIQSRVLFSTSFESDSYGRRQAEAFEALVRRSKVSSEEYARFMRCQEELAAVGGFFYSVTMFAYVGRKQKGAVNSRREWADRR